MNTRITIPIAVTLIVILSIGHACSDQTPKADNGALGTGVTRTAPEVSIADLGADPALDRKVLLSETALKKARHGDDATSDLIDAVSSTTGHPFVLLGQVSLPATKVEAFSGQSAREILKALADVVGSSWQEYESFYLLCTPRFARHSAKPVRMDKNYPELARKVSEPCSGFLTDVVRVLGGNNRAITFLCAGTGYKGPGPLLPAVVSARGRSLDEIMRALTVTTGDPWEHYHSMHVLSLTGAKLTEVDRQNLDKQAQSIAWKRSLTGSQLEQLRSDSGLALTGMPAGQLRQLLVSINPMLQSRQVAIPDVVLRFNRNGPYVNAAGNAITVYQVTPSGWKTIGRIMYP